MKEENIFVQQQQSKSEKISVLTQCSLYWESQQHEMEMCSALKKRKEKHIHAKAQKVIFTYAISENLGKSTQGRMVCVGIWYAIGTVSQLISLKHENRMNDSEFVERDDESSHHSQSSFSMKILVSSLLYCYTTAAACFSI